MGDKKDNRKRIISGIIAVSLIILEIVLSNSYKLLVLKFGDLPVLVSFSILFLLTAVCLSGVIWPRLVFAPLIAIGNFIKTTRRISELPIKFEDLKSDTAIRFKEIDSNITKNFKEIGSQFVGISKRIDTLSSALPLGSAWIQGLQENGGVQKETLRKIHKVINEILANKDTIFITDAELAQVIAVIGAEKHYDTTDIEQWDLIFGIREEGYQLLDNQFNATKNALKRTTEERLGGPNHPITKGNVRAFFELTKHVNQWEFSRLSQNCFTQLQNIRASRQFVEEVKNKSGKLRASYVSMYFVDDLGYRRIWKRVWPNNDNAWGNIRCLNNGSFCRDGQLNEISLCGAYCRSCKLNRNHEISGLELDLPGIAEPIKVRNARFSAHFGHFSVDSTRLTEGFGIEFLNLKKKDFAQLALFVRDKEELDKTKLPPNAPWLQT